MTTTNKEGTACCNAMGMARLEGNKLRVTCDKCGRDCSDDLIEVTISEEEYWNRKVAFMSYLSKQNFPLEKLFKE